jgi:hypothetical protein
MKLLKFTVKFSIAIATLLWLHLWKWCYPQSTHVLNELANREVHLIDRISSPSRLIWLCINMPSIARSQQIAESSATTQTKGIEIAVEPRWRGSLREWLIWTVAIGWIVMAVSIVTSFAQTGNFLSEYGPESGRPELVTPYFKVVALALLAQLASVTSGLALLRIAK